MLKRNPEVPWNRTLIDIGYKYNYHKVLYFIDAEGVGIANTGIRYLSKHPNQFANVEIQPVSNPLFMSKFVVSVNEVDSHNKYR